MNLLIYKQQGLGPHVWPLHVSSLSTPKQMFYNVLLLRLPHCRYVQGQSVFLKRFVGQIWMVGWFGRLINVSHHDMVASKTITVYSLYFQRWTIYFWHLIKKSAGCYFCLKRFFTDFQLRSSKGSLRVPMTLWDYIPLKIHM